MNPKVAIIILNWNGWKDTIECLESLYQITYPNYYIIIVDNGSNDGSIEKIRRYAQGKNQVKSIFFTYDSGNKPIEIIEYRKAEVEAGGGKENEICELPSNKKLIIIINEENYGFAKGNNIGIEYASKALNPDYFLLLNNDTIVDKEFIESGIELMENDNKIAIVTGKIYYYNDPKKVWAAGGYLRKWTGHGYGIGHNRLDKGQFNKKKKVDYAPGTMALINEKIFHEVGLLPDCYFGTGEEMEFAIKTSRKGYDIVYDPNSIIFHKVGMSSNRSLKYRYNFWRSNLLFMERNFPNIIWKTGLAFYIFIYLFTKLITLNYNELKCFLLALNDHKNKKFITEADLNKIEKYFNEKIKS